MERLPEHVAIIMDGNGRWAQQRGLPRTRGHEEGARRVEEIVRACIDVGIRYLTLFTFSTENWERPREEVEILMNLLRRAIQEYQEIAHQQGIRVEILGERSRLPEDIRKAIEEVEQKTAVYRRLHLVLALSYSGKWEITETTRRILTQGFRIHPSVVTEEFWQACMPSAHLPPVDLLIRTGGELRISNFLLWQCAYAEFYFTPILWPDFGRTEFFKALKDWKNRERRFGKIVSPE